MCAYHDNYPPQECTNFTLFYFDAANPKPNFLGVDKKSTCSMAATMSEVLPCPCRSKALYTAMLQPTRTAQNQKRVRPCPEIFHCLNFTSRSEMLTVLWARRRWRCRSSGCERSLALHDCLPRYLHNAYKSWSSELEIIFPLTQTNPEAVIA
jgi:hypothetical protein